MYENYALCDALTPSEICFVVEQYSEALQQLGRFLIRHGAGQGRPAKTSAGDVMHFAASGGRPNPCAGRG
jgi:hypothetical protein